MTKIFIKDISLTKFCILILSIIIIVRTISLGFYPVFDTTEARYGEMVRLMLETGDWITPSFDYNVPFLGKPPLFIWLAAISAKIFGFSEFSIRFASIITSIITMFIVWQLANFQMHKRKAFAAITIIATSAIYMILSGAVIAEPSLLLSISMISSGFWIGWNSTNKKQALIWQYIFFIGFAVGLLAKGLVVCVLGGLPIILWCAYTRQLKIFWYKFPWLKGTLLCLLLALPWYILAEIKNPGFLKYFIIGEHFSRYLQPGWVGDRYGTAHNEPFGSIWSFWLAGALPWSIVFIIMFILNLKKWLSNTKRQAKHTRDDWQIFLYFAFFSPLIFFSFAHNIIWTYAFAAIVPMGLLLANNIEYKQSSYQINKPPTWMFVISTTMLIVLILTSSLAIFGYFTSPQKQMLNIVNNQHKSFKDVKLIYWKDRPFSARFYSKGNAKLCSNLQELEVTINSNNASYYFMKQNKLAKLPEGIKNKLIVQKRFDDWLLLTINNKQSNLNMINSEN